MDRDNFAIAQEALDFGLVDEIIWRDLNAIIQFAFQGRDYKSICPI